MDTEITELLDEKQSFLKYVFELSDDNKNEIINMIQYTVIALIPVLLILKAVKHLIPEEDETKGSLEIIVETVGQLIFMVGAIWFLDRIIRYIPTYTSVNYTPLNPVSFLIPLLVILSTMQTKFGAKLNILVDRSIDAWNGKTDTQSQQQSQQSNVRVVQPLSGQHQVSQADSLDTNQLLPNNRDLTSIPSDQQRNITPQEGHDFNQMYQNTVTPLQNASTPSLEPMAANDGGTMFGGW